MIYFNFISIEFRLYYRPQCLKLFLSYWIFYFLSPSISRLGYTYSYLLLCNKYLMFYLAVYMLTELGIPSCYVHKLLIDYYFVNQKQRRFLYFYFSKMAIFFQKKKHQHKMVNQIQKHIYFSAYKNHRYTKRQQHRQPDLNYFYYLHYVYFIHITHTFCLDCNFQI